MIVAAQPTQPETYAIEPNRMVLQLLRRHPIWAKTPEANLRALAAVGRRVDLAPGQVAVREGETSGGVHLLIEGAVRTYYPGTRARRSLTVRLTGAPGVFGDLACLEDRPYGANVEALVHSLILSFPAERYFGELLRDPATCMRQYRDLGRRFAGATQYELSTATGGSPERIGALLLAYAQICGRPIAEGILIDLPVPQESIAEQTGTNRRTVVRVLERFYDAGAVLRLGRKLVLVSEEKLRASLKPSKLQPPSVQAQARAVAAPAPA